MPASKLGEAKIVGVFGVPAVVVVLVMLIVLMIVMLMSRCCRRSNSLYPVRAEINLGYPAQFCEISQGYAWQAEKPRADKTVDFPRFKATMFPSGDVRL